MTISKRVFFRKITLYIGHFLLGSLILIIFSTLQKLTGGIPIKIDLYIVPFFFGGAVGLIIFIFVEKYIISSRKFRDIFLQTNQAIVLTNPEEIIVSANPQALLLFETPKEVFIGSSILDRCPNTPHCKEQTSKFEMEFPRKSGEKKLIEVSTKKIKSSMRYINQRIFRDLSEEKLLENKMILETRLDSISFMAQGIAHDFYNTITIIMNNLIFIKEDLHSPTKNLSQMEQNIIECLDASAQAEKLISYLNSLASKRKPNKIKGSFIALIKKCVNFAFKGSEIIVEIVSEPDFPDFVFDPDQIYQVLLNLILNAIQSMDNKGKITIKTKTVEFSSQEDLKYKKFGKISIRDHGYGISPENINKIFIPYFTTKKKGHGIGLAMCQKIVQDHDGFISVNSKVNEGTTVSVFLPLLVKDS